MEKKDYTNSAIVLWKPNSEPNNESYERPVGDQGRDEPEDDIPF